MIEKITDQNLERYDSRLKEWCDRKFFEKGNYGKYQTTEEAGAVAFYPTPNTPLEGKVKFSFKEIMPVEGTKGPDNPSTIIGINEVCIGRCGKNLLKMPYNSTDYSNGSFTYTTNNDGTVVLNGYQNATSVPNNFFRSVTDGSATGEVGSVPSIVKLDIGKSYTFSLKKLGGSYSTYNNVTLAVINHDAGLMYNFNGIDRYKVFTPTAKNFRARLEVTPAITYSNLLLAPQLELGNEETSFEPYQGNDYTLQLGDTYYGGEIDLATGTMIVSRFGIILDSSIPLLANGAYGYAHTNTNGVIFNRRIAFKLNGDDQEFPRIQEYNYNSDDVISISHFKRGSHFDSYDTHPIFIIQDFPYHWLIFRDDRGWLFSDSRTFSENYLAFLNWLDAEKEAGTPVILTYKLEDPFTVQLTPQQILSLPQLNKYTPRLNTVYTDADSIQISYLRSPSRDEYEKTQAILSLGGNS